MLEAGLEKMTCVGGRYTLGCIFLLVLLLQAASKELTAVAKKSHELKRAPKTEAINPKCTTEPCNSLKPTGLLDRKMHADVCIFVNWSKNQTIQKEENLVLLEKLRRMYPNIVSSCDKSGSTAFSQSDITMQCFGMKTESMKCLEKRPKQPSVKADIKKLSEAPKLPLKQGPKIAEPKVYQKSAVLPAKHVNPKTIIQPVTRYINIVQRQPIPVIPKVIPTIQQLSNVGCDFACTESIISRLSSRNIRLLEMYKNYTDTQISEIKDLIRMIVLLLKGSNGISTTAQGTYGNAVISKTVPNPFSQKLVPDDSASESQSEESLGDDDSKSFLFEKWNLFGKKNQTVTKKSLTGILERLNERINSVKKATTESENVLAELKKVLDQQKKNIKNTKTTTARTEPPNATQNLPIISTIRILHVPPPTSAVAPKTTSVTSFPSGGAKKCNPPLQTAEIKLENSNGNGKIDFVNIKLPLNEFHRIVGNLAEDEDSEIQVENSEM